MDFSYVFFNIFYLYTCFGTHILVHLLTYQFMRPNTHILHIFYTVMHKILSLVSVNYTYVRMSVLKFTDWLLSNHLLLSFKWKSLNGFWFLHLILWFCRWETVFDCCSKDVYSVTSDCGISHKVLVNMYSPTLHYLGEW